MKDIKHTHHLVKEILETVPETRNSDMLLYYHVCLEIDKTVLKLPFWLVLLDLKHYGLPPIESVGRVRRKLQEECPELRAVSSVKEKRTENEEIVKEYARAVNV